MSPPIPKPPIFPLDNAAISRASWCTQSLPVTSSHLTARCAITAYFRISQSLLALAFPPQPQHAPPSPSLTPIPSSTPAPAELPPLIAPAILELESAIRGTPPLPHQLRCPSSHRPLHQPTLLLRFPHPNSPPLLQSASVGLGWHPHRATPILAGIEPRSYV